MCTEPIHGKDNATNVTIHVPVHVLITVAVFRAAIPITNTGVANADVIISHSNFPYCCAVFSIVTIVFAAALVAVAAITIGHIYFHIFS